jgi:hypothetical protein
MDANSFVLFETLRIHPNNFQRAFPMLRCQVSSPTTHFVSVLAFHIARSAFRHQTYCLKKLAEFRLRSSTDDDSTSI